MQPLDELFQPTPDVKIFCADDEVAEDDCGDQAYAVIVYFRTALTYTSAS